MWKPKQIDKIKSAPIKPTISLIEPKNDNHKQTGYCIRTGIKIPFDIEKPMSYDAHKLWSKFDNPDFAEKYCHFSGELSNGETSISKPIQKKNWKKAREVFSHLADALK